MHSVSLSSRCVQQEATSSLKLSNVAGIFYLLLCGIIVVTLGKLFTLIFYLLLCGIIVVTLGKLFTLIFYLLLCGIIIVITLGKLFTLIFYLLLCGIIVITLGKLFTPIACAASSSACRWLSPSSATRRASRRCTARPVYRSATDYCTVDSHWRFHAGAGEAAGARLAKLWPPNLAVLLTRCGQLVIRRISKSDATRCQILRLKCIKFKSPPQTPLGELSALH